MARLPAIRRRRRGAAPAIRSNGLIYRYCLTFNGFVQPAAAGRPARRDSGRHAAAHAFGETVKSFPQYFPDGIYAIPDISVVGRNEIELIEAGTAYEVGKATYWEIARGQIMGDLTAVLK